MKLFGSIAIILLCSAKVFSQGSIGTSLNLTFYSQQQYYNGQISLPGVLTNTGNQQISDSITMNCAVDTGNGSLNIISSSLLGFITMQVGDTTNFNVTFQINPSDFRVGNNIVVVWPVAVSPSIQCQTVSINCEVLGYNSVNELNSKQQNLFPNPFKEQIFLSDNTLKQVRIFNALGQTFTLPVTNGAIQFNDSFKPGLYVIELNNGKHVKVVKE